MYLTRWTSASDTTSEVGDFKYSLLKSFKTGIRLAQILPGTGNKGISINLLDSFVSGPQKIPYDALSQERIKERNQQVQLMGQIFKGARKVVVWLGEDYDDSRAGMQLAKQLLSIARYQPVSGLGTADLETHGLPKQGHRRWTALSLILRRPWFWRTWVVQEVVLNPNVELVLGPSMLTWDDLESVVALLEGPMPRVWQLDQAISASELPFSRINRIRLRHQRLIATPISPVQIEAQFDNHVYSEPESMIDEDDDPQLLDLLLMSRGLGATDPRDKVYALLGLGKHDINPDYSMSPESVFTDFALQTVGVVTEMQARRRAASLEMLSHLREVRRAMILFSCAGRHNQKLKLPSWVPDWTTNLSCRPLVFGLSHRFAAGGDKLATFDWQPDFGLLLCGKLLDSVQDVGSVHLSDTSSTNSHDLIKKWLEEAKQIAFTRIARSPGSTMNVDAFEAMRRDISICKHGYYITAAQKGRRNSLLHEVDTSDDASHSASQTLTLGPTRGRVVFASGTGYVGLVPHGTREGDLIFVVLGADVPYVLRPLEEGEGYELIGEAFVQGVMAGEAMLLDRIPVEDVMIR
ncbi:uncharacterized protein LTR77_007691 [Saxophila tyrrhenica]|uniref:Heterokaryon incompatibility domain-containing protein n=1 Tax=Saxophila tyrrhenica TaxID=1690608 RepID=A0AAV9P659_9PEZI|nr:hypothetical protein LTR77_007691 [Saxophila tyrrhenica]